MGCYDKWWNQNEQPVYHIVLMSHMHKYPHTQSRVQGYHTTFYGTDRSMTRMIILLEFVKFKVVVSSSSISIHFKMKFQNL